MSVDLRLYALVDPEHAGGRELRRASAAGGARRRDAGAAARQAQRHPGHGGARAGDQGGAGAVRRAACSSTTVSTWRSRPVPTACMWARPTWRSRMRGGCSGATPSSGFRSRPLRRPRPRPSICSTMSASAACFRPPRRTIPIRRSAPADWRASPPCSAAGRRHFPLCGIAGIDAGNAADTIAAGADGVAVISALSLERDPQAAAQELRGIVDAALAQPGRVHDSHRRHHRRLGFGRRRRHPSRSQDVLGARGLRRLRHHRPDRAEHQGRHRDPRCAGRNSSPPRSMRSFPISTSAR